jgi:agmatinase
MSSVASQQTRQGWHSVLVGGIATFMGAPQVEADADALRAAGVKAAFLGMPFDSTTIARPGAQLGPRAVRDWSSHMLSYHGEYDLDIFEALGVADMGDVAVVPANAPKTVDLVADAMGEAIKAGAIPVLCGGEHITTIGGSMAVDRHAPEGTYGLILVDTHLDTAPDVGGERINHCCPITRAMELAAFDPAKCVIIGPHGAMNPKSEYAYVRESGVTVFHVSDVDRRGARAIAEDAVRIASDGTDGVYFSFDVDSLDSSVCTGTCVPTMGGLTAREALTMVSVIGRADIVAMDVCEVAPAYDNGESAMAACQVIADTLAAYADSHR